MSQWQESLSFVDNSSDLIRELTYVRISCLPAIRAGLPPVRTPFEAPTPQPTSSGA